MPRRLSLYARQRAKELMAQGASVKETMGCLHKEGIFPCRQTVWRFKRHYDQYGSIEPLRSSGRPTKLTDEVLQVIETAMQEDDETTASELSLRLQELHVSHISLRTILKGRKLLGWTFRGSAYCQLIRAQNKEKRLEWAERYLHDGFEDVVWTDETTVQLETHRRFCCRKNGQKPRYKPRPKHPVKVHVWAGISWKGRTEICIFEGIMNAEMYTDILAQCLVPFIQRVYPAGHRFMQDNDPKHTSRHAREFFAKHNINWWRTPPESPDANPIENLWHELKVGLCAACQNLAIYPVYGLLHNNADEPLLRLASA